MLQVPKLKNPPIIETVLDIDCELQPAFNIKEIEKAARKALARDYPKLRPIFFQDHKVEATPDKKVKYSVEGGLQDFQFLSPDEKQIVQYRSQGFSFNRLAPYTSLQDYLPQIKKRWLQYAKIAKPVQVKSVRLRYINRILLPWSGGNVNLDEYILNGPRLADPERLTLTGFLDQYSAIDRESGYQINSVLTVQPAENDNLPIIFDNGVVATETGNVDWARIRKMIIGLRELNNHIFVKTLTEKCLNLFQ